MKEDTFSKDIESSMVAAVTEVDPRKDFPQNWLFDLIACFDYNL